MSLSQKSSKKLFKGGIMLALMFGIGMIPAPMPLTQMGMQLLGVFVGVLFGWIFIEVGSTSLIAIAALCMWGINTPTDILLNTFGSHISLMMLAVLLLAVYIDKLALGDFFIKWLMHRKIVIGRPYVFFSFLLLGSFLIALASSSLASAVIMISIWRAINEKAKFETNSRQHCAFFVGALIASLMGELCLPIKGAVVVYTNIYAVYSGEAMDLFRYMIAMVPAALSILVAYILFCKYILRINYSNLMTTTDLMSKEVLNPLTKQQKIGCIITIIFMVSLMIPSIPLPFEFWKTLQTLGLGGLSVLLMGIFYFIETDEKPLLNIKGLGNNFSWDMWFMVITITYISGQITNESTGIQAMVKDVIYPLLDGLSSFTLIIVLIILTIILTNFINNIVAGTLMISFAGVLSGVFDMNMGAVVLVLALSAMNAYATPAASPNAAIFFGQKDLISFKSMCIHGTLTVLFLIVYIIGVIYPWLNFIM